MAEYQAIPTTLRTFKYPLELDGSGGLKMSYGIDVVRDEIRSVLETYQFERIMRPKYGLPQSMVFSSYWNASVVAERIRLAIFNTVRYPNLYVSVSVAPSDSGAFEVIVNWALQNMPQPLIRYRFSP